MLQETESNDNNGTLEDVLLYMKSIEETNCYLEFDSQTYTSLHTYCNRTWDGLSCWPATPGGSMASIPCFSQFNGVQYDISSNASRFCHSNGSWSTWSNYRSCSPLSIKEAEILQGLWDTKEAATIYYVGYSMSLVALTLALLVFLRFKDLRCLRNNIHTNLMVTYLLIDVTWILTDTMQSNPNPTAAKIGCFLVILLMYLMATNFFWMLVEGLYLYMLVVKTFSIENVSMKAYASIGWGIPAVVATSWALTKAFAGGGSSDEPFSQRGCPWQNRDYYDYVFSCPVMVVLLINIFFLSKIMWVLITKLRASNSQESKQYWKAAKALLVLIPLLGVTYIIVIATPSNPVAEVVFIYIQATLLSIQGFMVAVLYCFLNGEVQNSLKSHLERWRTQKNVGKMARQSTRHHSKRQNSNKFVAGYDSCQSQITTTSSSAGNTTMKDVKCLKYESQNKKVIRGHML